MKSKKLGLFLTLSLVLTGALAFAQDAPKEEESPIKISGVNFTSVNMNSGAVNKTVFANNLVPFVTFAVDRLYLKWDHDLGKNFSYHVILDVAPDQFAASTINTANATYVPFVKAAYLRVKGGDENLFLTFDVGVVGTPILANRNKMADTRWFEDTMHNGHKNLIGMVSATSSINKSLDSAGDYDQSADLGAQLEVKVIKMISLTLGVYTGEGHANISKDGIANYSGKAFYTDLFVEPIKGLFVHAYWRAQNVLFLNGLDSAFPTSQGKDTWFAGAGAGINMMGIRAGADFESGQNITKNATATGLGDQAKNFFVFNAWLNWNLNEIAGFPMLVVGRFSYGMYNDMYATYGGATGGTGVVYDTVYWNAGLGWQFNKSVRVVLMFEMNMYSDAEIYMQQATANNPYNVDAMATTKAGNTGWNNSAHAIKLKTEVKF